MMATAVGSEYPAQFDVEYAEARDRVTVLFRIILMIPVLILASLLTNAAQYLAVAVVLMLLFRKRYPRVWFDWYLYINQFAARAFSYSLLLVDEYPSTTEPQRITLQAQMDEERLSRWLPLVKWLLALPHLIVLAFLFFAAAVVVFLAWFIILITGRYPRGMFNFVVGVYRWAWRVTAYAFLLSTDRYPPFSLR